MIPATNIEKLRISTKMTILFAFKDSLSIDISFEAGVSVGVGVHAGAGGADEFCGLKMSVIGEGTGWVAPFWTSNFQPGRTVSPVRPFIRLSSAMVVLY